MADIPHELLMTEIVSRLPAKSVCRFRCVSKPWCELISDSNFIKLHLKRAISRDERDILASDYEEISRQLECTLHSEDGNVIHTGIGRFMWYRTLINWIDGNSLISLMNFKDPFGESFAARESSKLLGSCNGIVCLVKKRKACLINPCTTEYKIVKFDKDVDFLREAAYGFGYDAILEDFKLVQIVDTENDQSEINVYSMNDAVSNKLSNLPFRVCTQKGKYYDDEKCPGFYLNGDMYCVVQRKFNFTEQLIAFDVGTNHIRDIPRPDSISKDANEDDWDNYSMACLSMGVIGGRLALFKRSYDYIEIWVLDNNSTQPIWCQVILIKKRFYECGEVAWPSCFGDWRVRPLHFTKTGEVLIKDEKHLVMYSLNEMENKNLDIEGIPDLSRMDTLVLHCPSLVPLKSGRHARVEMEE